MIALTWGMMRRTARIWTYVGRFLGLVFLACAAIPFVKGEAWNMPRRGEVLDVAGLGPFTLYDVHPLNTTRLPELSGAFWGGVTILSAIGGYFLIRTFVRTAVHAIAPQIKENREPAVYLLLACSIYLVATLAVVGASDRYVMPILPLILAAVSVTAGVPQVSGRRLTLALATCLPLAALAVVGTRDYFSWNRARWQALEDLRREGVPPRQIDGGFEFNGFHIAPIDERERPYEERLSFELKPHARFVVAFRPVEELAVSRTYTYAHWMPPYVGTIVVLERDDRESGVAR
jgi:hypothetical protein